MKQTHYRAISLDAGILVFAAKPQKKNAQEQFEEQGFKFLMWP